MSLTWKSTEKKNLKYSDTRPALFAQKESLRRCPDDKEAKGNKTEPPNTSTRTCNRCRRLRLLKMTNRWSANAFLQVLKWSSDRIYPYLLCFWYWQWQPDVTFKFCRCCHHCHCGCSGALRKRVWLRGALQLNIANEIGTCFILFPS